MIAAIPSKAKGATYTVSWTDVLINGAHLENVHFSPSMWIEIIQIIMFMLISLCAIKRFSKNDWIIIYSKIIKATRIYVFFCFPEVVLLYLWKNNSFRIFADRLLGDSTATVTSMMARQDRFVLCGLTKEPSHYAFTLAVIILLNVGYLYFYKNITEENTQYREKRSVYFTIVLCSLYMMLAMSFSSYYFIMCIVWFFLVIHYCKNENKSIISFTYIIGIVLALITILLLLPQIISMMNINTFLGRRVLSLIQELKASFNGNWLDITYSTLELSNKVRIGSTIETLKLVVYRPVFGLGLSAVTAHSSFAMLLAGCGFVGSYLYIQMCFYIRKINIVKYRPISYTFCIGIYCFMNLFNSMALRPYYEVWVLLLGVAFQFFASVNTVSAELTEDNK
jgi:hypothetical protein